MTRLRAAPLSHHPSKSVFSPPCAAGSRTLASSVWLNSCTDNSYADGLVSGSCAFKTQVKKIDPAPMSVAAEVGQFAINTARDYVRDKFIEKGADLMQIF